MTTFDWCLHGDHDNCKRSFERTVIDPKTNKPVSLDETVECECRKRGCPCYVKAADRTKTKKRKRKS